MTKRTETVDKYQKHDFRGDRLARSAVVILSSRARLMPALPASSSPMTILADDDDDDDYAWESVRDDYHDLLPLREKIQGQSLKEKGLLIGS